MSSMGAPFIQCIRSSAGSGKTYRLTLNFLKLLKSMGNPSGEGLKEIVAITFTNRAASEMKERILKALKEIAFETENGKKFQSFCGLTPEEAMRWADVIIETYTSFNVRTIDSFIYLIVRALSLEMGISPDEDVSFNAGYIAELSFERIISSPGAEDVVEKLLDTFLNIEGRSGFSIERKLKKTLTDLYERFQDSFYCNDNLYELWDSLGSKIEEKARALMNYLERKDILGKLKKKPSVKEKLVKLPNPKAASEILKMGSLPFRKNMKDERANELFLELIESLKEYSRLYPIMRALSYSQLLSMMRDIARGIMKEEKMLISSYWLIALKELMENGSVDAAYALSKLGYNIKHFLIDEFQDTSREQWEVLFPIIEESLSRGGSLFYVGDVKQSIYGWRGGDWRLLNEVMDRKPFPSVEDENYKKEDLSFNWRSLEDIVSFNNNFFSFLRNDSFVSSIVEKFFKDAPEDFKKELTLEITRNYSNVIQRVGSSKQALKKGIIKIVMLDGKEYSDPLLSDLESVWKRRKEATVLVRSNSMGEEISSLLASKGYPVVTENSLKIGNSPIVKGLVCLLMFLEDINDRTSLYGFLKSPIAEGLFEKEKLHEFLDNPEKLGILWDDRIKPILERYTYLGPYNTLAYATDVFDIKRRFPGDWVFVRRFMELVYNMEGDGKTLYSMIEEWKERRLEEKIGLPEGIDAVRVMTIHKAKGLEFSAVFVPIVGWRIEEEPYAIHNGNLIYLKSGLLCEEHREIKFRERAKQFIETLNLIYVAFTRAKEELYIYVEEPDKRRQTRSASFLVRLIVDEGVKTSK